MTSTTAQDSSCERFSEIVEEIESGRHRHIVLLIGSAVSFSPPTCCPSVGHIRNELVLKPLENRIRTGIASGDFSPETLTLLERIRNDERSHHHAVPLTRDVDELPFEQFMGCLSRANRDVADRIVQAACGPAEHGEPNHNHIAAALLGASLLDAGKADTVTFLTTNYDMGLEQAIQGRVTGAGHFVPISTIAGFVPAVSTQLPSGKSLQVVKLHGCIKRGLLVYAFSQMARLVYETKRLFNVLRDLSGGSGLPTLYLTLGYSFSDPDLRPMFLDAMSRTTPLIYRNERPQTSGSESQSTRRDNDRALAGSSILQEEFFSELKRRNVPVLLHHSDLAGRDSLLVRLARQYWHGDIPVADTPKHVASAGEGTAQYTNGMDEAQVLIFLGGLVDACARSDALQALGKGLARATKPELRGELARLYLSQFGHAHLMSEAAKACVQLRREHKDIGIRIRTAAYRSFALTLGPAGHWRINHVGAALPLLSVRHLKRRVDTAAQIYYSHYSLHYWVKATEVLAGVLSRFLGRVGEFVGRVALRSWMASLLACFESARNEGDMETAADVESLITELCIIRRQDAVERAGRNRQIRAALGTLNRVALVDRQLGWANLSLNSDEGRAEAVRALARGLWLATYSNDWSLEPKLTAELVRCLYSGMGDQLLSDAKDPPRDEYTGVRRICRQVGLANEPVIVIAAPDIRRALVRHLRFLYFPNDQRVLELIGRYCDTGRYPMLLVPDPTRPPDRSSILSPTTVAAIAESQSSR